MTLASLRPAHEGRVIAVALGDLLGGAPEQHHGVGRLQAGAGAEGELDLARPELDLDGAQRQAEIDDVGAQDLQDGIHLVVALLGQVLVALVQQRHVGRLARLAGLAGIADAELALLQLEQMELDFEAGDEVVAAIGQRLQRALRRHGACRAASAGRRGSRCRTASSRNAAPTAGRGRSPGSGSITTSAAPSSSFMPKPAARLPDREHRAVRGVLQQHGGR